MKLINLNSNKNNNKCNCVLMCNYEIVYFVTQNNYQYTCIHYIELIPQINIKSHNTL